MAQEYDTNVFINCPFDSQYRPLFEAVTFAVYDCGFYPRCSLEVDDSSQVRIEKITSIIKSCRFSIHDISRTQLDSKTKLPRFNMPFELGIVFGAKSFGSKEQKRKVAVILDSQPYRYQQYLSDIAGQDIRDHQGKPEIAVHRVRDFLSTHCSAGVVLPGGDKMVERYQEFRSNLPNACKALHLDDRKLNFRDLTTLIVGWMTAHSLGDSMSA